MRVVNFIDWVPNNRYDNNPWTTATIQEAPAEAGPWTTIDVKPLIPVDSDPENPRSRNFTTQLATLDDGWYRIVFTDATTAEQEETSPIHDIEQVERAYEPNPDDVGKLLRARTKDRHGNELGRFSEDTRPTAEEVVHLIDQSAMDVTSLVDFDIPLECYPQARAVIALGAALRVELSYFPEQVAANKSAYAEYRDMYKDSLDRLLIAVQREAQEEATGEAPMLGNMPAFGFPVEEGLLFKRM